MISRSTITIAGCEQIVPICFQTDKVGPVQKVEKINGLCYTHRKLFSILHLYLYSYLYLLQLVFVFFLLSFELARLGRFNGFVVPIGCFIFCISYLHLHLYLYLYVPTYILCFFFLNLFWVNKVGRVKKVWKISGLCCPNRKLYWEGSATHAHNLLWKYLSYLYFIFAFVFVFVFVFIPINIF